jgi:hypothetical protein
LYDGIKKGGGCLRSNGMTIHITFQLRHLRVDSSILILRMRSRSLI